MLSSLSWSLLKNDEWILAKNNLNDAFAPPQPLVLCSIHKGKKKVHDVTNWEFSGRVEM